MKLTSMELIECLYYLRQREEDLLFEIEASRDMPDGASLREFAEGELKVVRDLKHIVEVAEEG